jgi:type IV secretory pathway VirD2 relaxase
VFYDAARDQVNARPEVAKWADDRHHFRLIVSPEHGGDIPDMTAYVREVMRRVQRDLDTKLEWVAINHHNTDNPHAHIMLRGRREDGTDLVIPRRYLSTGIRDRASEVATELLGERSVQEVRSAKAKEVEAERFTSLDRIIERHLQKGQIDVSPSRRIGFDAEDRKLVVGRLQFLAQLDLARKERGTRWQVDEHFKRVLLELGARNDIIKQLYSSLGTEAGRVERVVSGPAPSAPVSGLVIAKGSPDEIGEDRFLVVRDRSGKAHYGRVRDGQDFRDLQTGSIAQLGGGAQRRRQVTEQIAAVATANNGVYAAKSHEEWLRIAQPGLSDRQVASVVRSAAWRLEFARDHEGSGVRGVERGEYAIDPVVFQKANSRPRQLTDVQLLAAHPLPDQVQAHAVTWLDRQVLGKSDSAELRGHPAVREAIQQRRDWLVQHGYAVEANGSVTLRPDALRRLAAEERAAVAKRLSAKYDLPVEGLTAAEVVTGSYRGTEQLHSGKLAVVVTDQSVIVATVGRIPDVANGTVVSLERTAGRNATLASVASQSGGRQASRDIDGLEAGR